MLQGTKKVIAKHNFCNKNMLIKIKGKDAGTFKNWHVPTSLKFIYSEKTTKFCEISTIDLSYVVPVKTTVEISQNFVAFSGYMNFNILYV